MKSSLFYIFEDIFCSKYGIYNLALIGIIDGVCTINIFLYYVYTPWGLLNFHSKGVNTFSYIFIILLIDFNMIDNLKNYIFKVCCIFYLYSLNC